MTAVSVTFDGQRISEAEDETDGGTWDQWGKTQSPTQETDFVYQNVNSISNKISGATGGVDFDATTPVDFETTPRAIIAVVNVTTYGLINTAVAKGAAYQIGSGPSAYYEYNAFGSGTDYPAKGGFVILAIDPNVHGYRDLQVGSPDLTIVDYFGWWADITGTVKSQNIVHDTLSYIDSGTGLTLVSGDGGDTDGTFADFVSEDEGTIANRWGIVTTGQAEILSLGVLTIGTATATEFTDSNKVIVFPDARVNAGFFGINVGLQSASTAVSMTNCQFVGIGLASGHADTRPSYNVTGTSGAATFDSCTFLAYNHIVLTSGATVSDCIFVDGYDIDQNGATISGCSLSSATTIDGYAAVISDDPGLISSCNFTFSDGHAIVITVSDTFGFDRNVFTGYGVDGSLDAAILNDSGGLVTLNVTNASLPTVRNGEGSTTALNVSVDIEVNGVTEGTRIIMIGSGGAEDGVTLMAGYANVSGVLASTFGGTTPQAVIIRARNSGIINAAVLHDDDGSDTDYTNAARESTGSDDVILLPAVPAVNDAFYYGGIATFGELLINVTAAGDTYVLTWEYWNGAWTTISVTDNTNSYTTLGWNKVTFTVPDDWATTTFATFGPFYYIRARATTGGGTQPKAENITLNQTTKYLPFTSSGTIQDTTGITTTAVWIEDTINP